MISRVAGKVASRSIDRVEIMTAGGVAYEAQIPLSVVEILPKVGEEISLPTHVVVKDDGWQLFAFSSEMERRLFRKLLTANGVGPALALGMLSALSARRLIRALQEKDIATLQGVPRVGRKTAERMVLDLGDKLDDVIEGEELAGEPARTGGGEDAIRALISLGYSQHDAERGVRAALDGGGKSVPEVIRGALAELGKR
ncbi:MAG TPA: Holliday junction branch migration protein RuvA [Gemmatimonadaceae bacterium]|nr:Holliday junction branch migration protein RuvA [Gemmatimonadaceae bacterium]